MVESLVPQLKSSLEHATGEVLHCRSHGPPPHTSTTSAQASVPKHSTRQACCGGQVMVASAQDRVPLQRT